MKQFLAPAHQCSLCCKSYARREHLRRHIASHQQEKPYQCVLCGNSFQRADVLTRHVRACSFKSSGSSKPRTRRRSCNRCVHRKSACDTKLPCYACRIRGSECNYVFPETDDSSSTKTTTSNTLRDIPTGDPTAHDDPFAQITSFYDLNWFDYWNSNWQDFANIAPVYQDQSNAGSSNDTSPDSLSFLAKFTSNTGFVTSFDCGTELERQRVASSLVDSDMLRVEFSGDWSNENNVSVTDPSISASPTGDLDVLSHIEVGPRSCGLEDSLAFKAHEILLLTKEVVTIKTRGSVVGLEWSQSIQQECLSFFSPKSMFKYLEFYWAIWHPNVNFIHRPTFDPTDVKSILLAAMVLIGASVSPNKKDNENAKMWFNCVEEMVFMDEDFCNDLGGLATSNRITTKASQRKIQALQAAYMVVLYQNWEGTDPSKSRIRRYRYSTLVSASRDLNISMARHIEYHKHGRHEFNWTEFSTREELIRLDSFRTFLWIFLLDTGFTIFNNLPPRMVIREMGMHMAMPESCFQASTADLCFEAIQQYVPSSSLYWNTTVASAFRNLCDANYSSKVAPRDSSVGPLNLFALASAIHALIFQCQNFFVHHQSLVPVQNAVNNWRNDWQHYITYCASVPHVLVPNNNLQPPTMWERVGFCRYTPEFWLLASLKLDRLTGNKRAVHGQDHVAFPLETNGEDSMGNLDDGIDDPILNKFDQTSMRQVNDLISDFQRIHLQ